MPRKHQKKHQQDVPQAARAQRSLEKGDVKAGLKEAKRCFRHDPSEQHRQLLERAFLTRIQQLYQMNATDEAKEALKELQELPAREPEVLQQIPRLQVLLGDPGVNVEEVLAADPSLLVEWADSAVLGSQVAPHGFTEQVEVVRRAFAAVERGEDAEAAEQLKAISKNSPLADWRVFLRGLSAFYQQDYQRAEVNWQRLEPTRPASRLAQTLLAATGRTPPQPEMTLGLAKLEAYLRSDAAIDAVLQLAEFWKQGAFKKFLRQYRQLLQRFGQSHEALLGGVTDLVWRRAVREGNHTLLAELVKTGSGPEIDPCWNRAWALFMESPDSDASIEEVEACWMAYIEDIPKHGCLREEEQPVAIGLVHMRVAREFLQYAEQLQDGFFFLADDEAERKEVRQRAAKHYRASIRSCPDLQDAYLDLVDLHEQDEELSKAASVMEKLARQDPDCFEARMWLANYHLSEDEPEKSEPHVQAVKRLRPRDPRCDALTWNQQLTMVRCLTIKRKFQAAREQLEAAVQAAPVGLEPYEFDLLRAGIAFKAKDQAIAGEHLNAALAQVEDPTPLWMHMSGLSARMRVAREFKKTFDDNFKKAINSPPVSISAGRMSRFLLSIKANKANYTGRATQERLLLEYLKRSLDISWQQEDLRDVCKFLESVPRRFALRSKLIERGLVCFPEVPHFHCWAGLLEQQSGPFLCDIHRAVDCIEKGLALHNQGEIKLSQEELDRIRPALSMLKDVLELTSHMAAARANLDASAQDAFTEEFF